METANPPHAPPDASPPGATLRLAGAGLTLGGERLFDSLELTLPAGQWSCILGPSGVGKSSLLRLIAGLVPATPGTTITFNGTAPGQDSFAYMAQQDLLLPWLSLTDNAALGARLRGGKRAARAARPRAREILAALGLADRTEALPATCSGGMRQRAALARTLMEDRPIVLMDEPFSALDAITRHRLQALAAEALKGRTVLLVTHDPMEALRLGHRVHVMAGRPARLDAPLLPPGPPPRAPGDPALQPLLADLMTRLGAAERET